MEKREMPVLEGLQLITQRVKATAIYNAVGKPSAWYTQRVNSCSNNGSEFKFTQADVNLLNDAIQILAKRVGQFEIPSGTTRAVCIAIIREAGKTIKWAHFRENILHCNDGYWKNRTSMYKTTGAGQHFAVEDIDSINTELQDIAKMLHEITLTL